MEIFGQVWLWSLASFLLGALFTWALLVRPARNRVTELEDAAKRARKPDSATRIQQAPVAFESASRPRVEPVSAPDAANADEFLDDLFDSPRRSTPQPTPRPAPSLPPSSPPPLVHIPMPAETPRGHFDAGDFNGFDAGPTAPPEPPIPDTNETELADNPLRRFAESTTIFEPPVDLKAPPEIESNGGEDWFSKKGDEEPADVDLVSDVDDDENVDDGGTIFTSRTTPISAATIRDLDDSAPSPLAARLDGEAPAAERTQVLTAAKHELPERVPGTLPPATPMPMPEPASSRAAVSLPPVTPMPMPEPTVRVSRERAAVSLPPATPMPMPEPTITSSSSGPSHAAIEPDEPSGRSLFEPVVPAAAEAAEAEPEADAVPAFVAPGPFGPGSAMPLPSGGAPTPEFNVKASVTALRYCTKENPQFERIVAEVWFRTAGDAERVGFRVLS